MWHLARMGGFGCGAEWAGAAIVGGTVYWGSGYRTSEFRGLGYPGDNDKLYAFTLRGR